MGESVRAGVMPTRVGSVPDPAAKTIHAQVLPRPQALHLRAGHSSGSDIP